mmetsp:Transcript_773/g.3007  ORF Transcript_773/g.3007 Transcript_773/m.3007 type:complete len:335 (-) Transcript_773:448-1452(-)
MIAENHAPRTFLLIFLLFFAPDEMPRLAVPHHSALAVPPPGGVLHHPRGPGLKGRPRAHSRRSRRAEKRRRIRRTEHREGRGAPRDTRCGGDHGGDEGEEKEMRRVNYVEHEEHLQEPAHVRRRLGAFHGGGGRGRGFARRGARPEQRKGTCEKNLRQEPRASGDPRHHSHSAHLFSSFAETSPHDRPKDDRAEHRASGYAERETGPSARLEQDEAEAASTGLIKTPAPTDRPLEPSSQTVRHGHGDGETRERERRERDSREGVGGVEVVRDEKQRRARQRQRTTHRHGHFCACLHDSLCARGGASSVARQTPAAMVREEAGNHQHLAYQSGAP